MTHEEMVTGILDLLEFYFFDHCNKPTDWVEIHKRLEVLRKGNKSNVGFTPEVKECH